MEFHIVSADMPANLDAIQAILSDVDPLAVVDLDRAGVLRVSAETSAAGLVELLQRAGHPVRPSQVLEVPSFCCGSCGG